jgi:DNA adenine methylase
MTQSIKPFLKWAGGKQQLLGYLRQFIPKHYNRYFEPFVGSGALFFDIQPDKATIADINSELVNCYVVVKENVEELIEDLRKYSNSSEYFYKIRSQNPTILSNIERASRFIFLNRTCFNGLYRENKKGEFNVPFGSYKNPDIIQEEKLKIASIALKGVTILEADYKTALKDAKKGDFIYLDPPYFPLGGYSDFKRYHRVFFEKEDHEALANQFEILDKKGCYVMLSNSDTSITRNLYSKWRVSTVQARRLINCDATKRGEITELVVVNYEASTLN